MSSATGSPIQRLAFYLSEALSLKIANEDREKKQHEKKKLVVRHLEPTKCVNSIPIYFKQFPVTQITNLVGSHTILHYLDKVRRIHIVDLEIRSGVQWVQFMQDASAPSEHPIQHLKITAVGTSSKKSILEETGRQLASFAESVSLKFTFGVVVVEDVLELNQDLFELDADEAVVVYAAYSLVTMVGRAERLNHVMEVIKSLRPCIMVVTEMEANCNSPSFTERFVESLFMFGALFDSLAECLKGEETSRMDIESTLFRSSINNVLAAEGDEMMLRHVPIHVWRASFDGFGLLETELSFSSLEQANLLLRDFSYGSSVTLCRNGGCLTVGWKGTPLTSLSAWKLPKH
uniref:GRAS5 transcription factor n=1 Tax=Salvia miltiorrhiza TaxID=226208 RepID=A0A291I307_SALMI|nr:GRAS5 transcription factor [Salvia miltiorrhiza]